MGYADGGSDEITNHKNHTFSSYLLSDVYIMPKYRRNGYAKELILEMTKLENISNESIYLTLLYPNLGKQYSQL